MDSGIPQLQAFIDQADNIVFFGGAGVSTESGIPDFRSVDGLYSQTYRYPPETMLSRTFFDSNTAEFYRFYRDKVLALHAQPNAAHTALARLEAAGKLGAVVTQNIDGLHQQAGSRRVLELHGSSHRNNCMDCGKFYTAAHVAAARGVPRCDCGGVVKPDVVLYEEGLDQATVQQAIDCIRACDLLIIGGTSLVVYPAAGLVNHFRGGRLVVINKTDLGNRGADLFLQGSIGQILSRIKT